MQTEFIDYQAGELTMQGFMARKKSVKSQPLVLIVHDWSGCREFAQDKARYFAEQGYVGFAVDLYGKGQRGSDTDSSINQKLMGSVMQNRAAIVTRLQAALECATNLQDVNPSKVVALGFCFGGLCVLDFARAGANISAVISVHGLFFMPEENSKAKITAKVLSMHGYADKMATPDSLAAFHAEMTSRGADWQTHVFGNTSHAFTNPKANDSSLGLQYNSIADKRTWEIVSNFTREVFG